MTEKVASMLLSCNALLAEYVEMKEQLQRSDKRPFIGMYELDTQMDWLKVARYYLGNLERSLRSNDAG